MPLQAQPVAAPAASAAVGELTSSAERWAAWQAKGAAHDRAMRRKMALAAPIAIVAMAVIVYLLLGR